MTEITSAAIGIAAAAGEFLEVVTGAKSRTIGGKHHCAHGLVGRDFGEAVGQRDQQRLGQAVAGLRAIEHEDGDVLIAFAQQHGRISSERGWAHSSEVFPGSTPPNVNPKSARARLQLGHASLTCCINGGSPSAPRELHD